MSGRRYHFISLLSIWLISAGAAMAQWRGPILTQLGPSEGLPTFVNCIVSDSTGYRYIASNVGLYRYDGHEFLFYGHDPLNEKSIGPGEVYNLLAGKDGLIWMALRFGGLNSYNPRTGIFKRYPLPEMSFRSVPTAHALYEDPEGTLWVGGTHFRLMAFDRKSEKFTTYMPEWIDPEKDRGRLSILSITPDPHHPDTLWLCVLDYKSKGAKFQSFGLVAFRKSTKEFSDTPFAGYTRFVDSTGIMWGKQWGNFITRFDPASMQLDTFQHHFYHQGKDLMPLTRDLTSYQDNLLVASSLSVMEFDGQSFSPIINQKLTGEIYSLYADPDDNLWIGMNQGAMVLNPDNQHIRFFSLEAFGIYNRLFPGRLAYDDEAEVIYLSHTQTPNTPGYYRIPMATDNASEATFHPTSFAVQGLAIDPQHRLWAAGDGALYEINPHTEEISRPAFFGSEQPRLPWIMAMKSNEAGWIGLYGSDEFIWFNAREQVIKRIKLDQLPGSAFAKSFDNRFDGFSFNQKHTAYLYSNEVHQVDLKTGDIKTLRYDPLVNPNVQQIQYAGEDQDGFIWMSTFVHIGKYELKEDSLILLESFGFDQGMISSTASELHVDAQGRVWAFSASGMDAIDPDSREVRFFGTKEGLPIPFMDPRQVINLPDGRIATVCHNGLIVFNAEDLWKSGASENEPIIFKRIRIEGKEIAGEVAVNYLKVIELKPGNKGFDIEFQALAYPTDYKMEYSYRIIGLLDEWISIGRNQLITLPSLAPGEYTFEIKAGSPMSLAPVKKLQIIVHTPIYQKTWFILLLLLTCIAAVYVFLQWRIRRVRQQEEERAGINKKMAELELKALRSQMNPHFMFNSLNSIKNYILHAEPKLAAEYLSNFAHLIRMILQNSREKSITLQEELDTLILYIELEQIRFENKFEFSCEVGEGVQMEQIMIPPMLLQPFVENAIWHGLMHKKEKGNLILAFSRAGDRILCIIDDDGVGRDKAAKMKSLTATRYKSMGMGITRDRIEIMNKMDTLGISMEVTDKVDQSGKSTGTRVIVNIPGPPEN